MSDNSKHDGVDKPNNFSAFDELIIELESDPETIVQLNEARRWVKEVFKDKE